MAVESVSKSDDKKDAQSGQQPNSKAENVAFDNAVVLLSQAEAILDALSEVAPDADALNSGTLQNLCLMAHDKVYEAREKLMICIRVPGHG